MGEPNPAGLFRFPVNTRLGVQLYLAAFERALKVHPNYAEAHYNLADTLEDAGRFAQARSHWQAYLRLEPSGLWAKYARGRLA